MGIEGELIYERNFNYVVEAENDGNSHLNTADYFGICEKVRADFLYGLHLSDEIFNKRHSVGMRRGSWENPSPRHYLDLKNGENYSVEMKFYNLKNRMFRMVFSILNESREKVFETGTRDCFVDTSKDNVSRINIPEFFLEILGKSETS